MSTRQPQPQRVNVRIVSADDMPNSSTPVMAVRISDHQTLTVNSLFAVNCPEETGDGTWKITFAFDGQTYVGISPSAHDAVVQVMDSVKHAGAEAMTALRQYLAMWRDAVKQKEEEQQ